MASPDPYVQHTLANGLRIVIESMPHVRSAAAGFLVRTGARDEVPEQAGVSHFLEHMMFKGTAKRSWRDVTVDFDRMGSSYNAFTSEDRTVYYGWVPKDRIGDQMELLADMMRSTLPPDEFDTEKQVILEEIAMAKDSLEHLAFDFLQEKVFAGHPLAWPILGYEETIGAMKRETVCSYFQRLYAPNNMVLLVTGNVDPAAVIRKAERLCGDWPAAGELPVRVPPALNTGTDVLTVNRFQQQVVALTFPGVPSGDERAETASAIAGILGGDNSRFYWSIVQEGIAHRAGSFYLDYTDCGAMILYAVCQPDHAEQAADAMRQEARRIRDEGVQEHEVQRVRNGRRTGLAVQAEAPYHRLNQLIDDLESRGEPRTVEQVLADVDAVTVGSVASYLDAFPMEGAGHLTSAGPRHWP